jgi:hypothetical protein
MRPALAQAEHDLQGASLAHEAARREAQPYREAAAQARARADHWWGRWLLRRSLARLKERLDRLESARVAQEAARQQVFLLLTALEEELRGALEKAVGAAKPEPELAAWWRQLQAWSRRLEALELGRDEAASDERLQRSQLVAQARLDQLGRDLELLRALAARGRLDARTRREDEARLREAQRRWQALSRSAEASKN